MRYGTGGMGGFPLEPRSNVMTEAPPRGFTVFVHVCGRLETINVDQPTPAEVSKDTSE